MKIKGIALIGLAVMAILVAGCSQKSPMGPYVSPRGTTNTANSPTTDANINPITNNLLSLSGSMRQTNPEGGCLYFEGDNGKNYGVEFANPSMVYVLGQRIVIRGFLNGGAISACMIGQSFFVMDILSYSNPNDSHRQG